MDKLISIQDLSFAYPKGTTVFSKVSFDLTASDFCLMIGPTGSGKTTLLKQLKPELAPAGQQTGTIQFAGVPVKKLTRQQSAESIGFVVQNPRAQSIMTTVIDELVFPLENIGCQSKEIQRRVSELVSYLGLNDLLHQKLTTLSGGQLQLVNLATVLILQPKILLLDEPTSQLDPLAAQKFFDLLARIHDELGIAILLTEHRTDIALGYANRLLLMKDHQLTFDGTVNAGLHVMQADTTLNHFIPDIPAFFLTHSAINPVPLTVSAGRQALARAPIDLKLASHPQPKITDTPALINIKGATFSYEPNNPVLKDVFLTVPSGNWLTILGGNGTGKSTLLTLLAGVRKPQHGKLFIQKKPVWKLSDAERLRTISFVPQDPNLMFYTETVSAELQFQANKLGLTSPEKVVSTSLANFQLTEVANQSPFNLSGGQKQLLALAIALMGDPELLLLDEPTKGLDAQIKAFIGQRLKAYQKRGMTIVMASHDMAFSANYSDSCVFMFDGQLNQALPKRTFFARNFFFTTPINRLVRDQLPTALTLRDLATGDD